MTEHGREASEGSTVAVLGGGSIGLGWAVVFSRAGLQVWVYEPEKERRRRFPDELQAVLTDLADFGLLPHPVPEVAGRVVVSAGLEAALEGAGHVQECVPEALDLKQQVFEAADGLTPRSTTIASSTSAITATAIAAGLPGRERCLVAHPANPPYLLPVVELAPAEFTAVDAVQQVAGLLTRCGMHPIRIHREIEGLAYNRLQGALLREAYCLVRDGVIDPLDLELLVTAALGRRWSVVGPFSTVELNTRGGIRRHAEILGPAYQRMGAERGQHDPWTADLVARVAAEIHTVLPPERWAEHVRARDRQLMALMRAWTASPSATTSEEGE